MTQQTITPQLVKELRERTGVGMSKCKEALVAAEGDLETAVDVLRKQGMASASKKGSRETKEGLISFAENASGVALIEVNSETDFVAKNERFKAFLETLAQTILDTQPASVEAFMQQSSSDGRTLEEVRAEIVSTLGENIQVKRLLYIPKKDNTSYGVYVHMNGKIVSLVEITGSSDCADLAREIGMHIAAEAPDYLNADEVPAELKAREEEIAREQLKDKPPQIMDKIIAGKMNSFFDQICLLRQKWIKDPAMTVTQFVEDAGKKAGNDLALTRFVRWQMGE